MKGIIEIVAECLSVLLVFFRRRKSKRGLPHAKD